MATTATQKAPLNTMRMATGRYIIESGDTAAAITLTVGFKPRYVRVQNNTSGDGMEWFEGMADASAQKQVAAGDKTLITSNGITVSDRGFIIGLDTDVNVKAEQLSWVALG